MVEDNKEVSTSMLDVTQGQVPQSGKSAPRWIRTVVLMTIGLFFIGGGVFIGYWYGVRNPVIKTPYQEVATSNPTLPSAVPSQSEQFSKHIPFGISLIEDQSLKIFSISGEMIKTIPIKDILSNEFKISPDGQKIALFGLPIGLVGKYKPGQAAVPSDIFIYDITLNQLTRITDCLESNPEAVGQGEVDLCYTDFDWGPDSDTYVYTYMGTPQENPYVGIGKVSTGVRNGIYSFVYTPKFSPSGQKIFVSAPTEAPTYGRDFSLIDKDGVLIKRYTIDDFPIQSVVNREETNLFPIWGRSDSEAFLVVVERKEHQPNARNYSVVVYAFDPNNPSGLTSVTSVNQKGSYGGVLGVDSVTGNIVVQHFSSPMESTDTNVSVFSKNGELVAPDIATPIGSKRAIAYGIYNGFVSVGAEDGLWIISLSGEKPVKISDLPYAEGYIIP